MVMNMEFCLSSAQDFSHIVHIEFKDAALKSNDFSQLSQSHGFIQVEINTQNILNEIEQKDSKAWKSRFQIIDWY